MLHSLGAGSQFFQSFGSTSFRSQFSAFKFLYSQFQYFNGFAWHDAGGLGAQQQCSGHGALGQGGSWWFGLPPPVDREGGEPPAAAHNFRPPQASGVPILGGGHTLGAAGVAASGGGCRRYSVDGGTRSAGCSLWGTGASHLDNPTWGVRPAAQARPFVGSLSLAASLMQCALRGLGFAGQGQLGIAIA